MNKTPFFRFVFCSVLLIFCSVLPAWSLYAAEIFEKSYLESNRLDEKIYSATLRNIDFDPEQEFVYVTSQTLKIAHLYGKKLKVIAEKNMSGQEKLHRVHVGDFNDDGVQEILVNGTVRDRAFAKIFTFYDHQFHLQQSFDAAVMPLNRLNREKLFLQNFYGQRGWSGHLNEMAWNEKQYVVSNQKIRLSSQSKRNQLSLYQLTGVGENLLNLDEDGQVEIFNSHGKKLWKSGLKFGGAIDQITFKEKDPLGWQRETSFFLMPRTVYLPQHDLLAVIKNSGYLNQVIGRLPNIKATQYFLLRKAHQGFQEKSSSPRLTGAFSDINVVDFNQDGVPELLLTYWERQSGTLGTSDAVETYFLIVPIEGLKNQIPEDSSEKSEY